MSVLSEENVRCVKSGNKAKETINIERGTRPHLETCVNGLIAQSREGRHPPIIALHCLLYLLNPFRAIPQKFARILFS